MRRKAQALRLSGLTFLTPAQFPGFLDQAPEGDARCSGQPSRPLPTSRCVRAALSRLPAPSYPTPTTMPLRLPPPINMSPWIESFPPLQPQESQLLLDTHGGCCSLTQTQCPQSRHSPCSSSPFPENALCKGPAPLAVPRVKEVKAIDER